MALTATEHKYVQLDERGVPIIIKVSVALYMDENVPRPITLGLRLRGVEQRLLLLPQTESMSLSEKQIFFVQS